MNNDLKLSVINVKNPSTGQSLVDEGRLIDIYIDDSENLKINYLSSGLKIEDKRVIEQGLIEAVKGKFPIKQIIVQSQTQTQANTRPPQAATSASIVQQSSPSDGTKKIASVKKIIAVSSGKGGVGKSTLAANLALAIAKQGKRVAILDADIYGPSIPLIMGVADFAPTINDFKKMIPARQHNIDIISFGFFVSKYDPVIWRGPMLTNVLKQLVFDVEWGEQDVLIIDFPPGTGDVQLSLAQSLAIDGAVIVTTPQQVAIQDTIKGKNMFEKMKIPIIGMVENMAYFICDKCSKEHYIFGKDNVKKICQEVGMRFLGSIPLYSPISISADQGHPLMLIAHEENSAAWKSYIQIAKQIVD